MMDLMSAQDQFLNVIDRDEAEARFRAALDLKPLGDELVPLTSALGRVLARDVVARVDVPSKSIPYFKPGKELRELLNQE